MGVLNRKALGIVGVTALAVATAIVTQTSPTRADEPAAHAALPPDGGRVAKLRQDRVAVLAEAAKTADELFSHNVGSIDDSIRLHKALLDARLDAAATKAERVALLTDAVSAAKDQEGDAGQRAKAGLVTPLVPMDARAYRLDLEIRLAVEQSK